MRIGNSLIVLLVCSAPAVWAAEASDIKTPKDFTRSQRTSEALAQAHAEVIGAYDPNEGYKPSTRVAELISESDNGDVLVKNVRWGRVSKDGYQWDTVAIKIQDLEEVYWGQENFGRMAAHDFIVFKFKPGGFENTRSDAPPSNYFVVSYEAHIRTNQNFSLIDGQFNKFTSVWNLSSLESFVANDVMGNKNPVLLFPISSSKMTMAQKHKMLKTAIRLATAGDHHYYNTTSYSCITNALRVINSALPKKEIHSNLPKVVTFQLQQAKLLRKPILINPKDPTGAGMIDPYPAVGPGDN